jgi:hypothetical protein
MKRKFDKEHKKAWRAVESSVKLKKTSGRGKVFKRLHREAVKGIMGCEGMEVYCVNKVYIKNLLSKFTRINLATQVADIASIRCTLKIY